MKEAMAQQKAQYGVSIADELNYWSGKISAFQKGSTEYHAIQMQQAELQSALYKQMIDAKKKYLADQSRGAMEGENLLGDASKALGGVSKEQQGRSTESAQKYNEEVAKGADIAAKNAEALSEGSIAIELQTGKLTQLAAAQQLAAIHTADHDAEIKKINDDLATQIELINQSNASAEDKANAIRNAQQGAANSTASANGNYATTQQRDASNIQMNTAGGKWDTAINQMVTQWSDMTGKLVSVFFSHG